MSLMQRTRSNSWHNTGATVSATVCTTSTDDPLARRAIVPAPTLHIAFGGEDDGNLTLTRAIPRTSRFAPLVPASAEQDGLCDPNTLLPHPHRVELSIDSLPNFMLIEPIPVMIDPVGDAAFTAWVPNLDINATGTSVIEALLMLKERIEFVYDDLNRHAHLGNDEKTTLQMLHTYIAPKKPEWV